MSEDLNTAGPEWQWFTTLPNPNVRGYGADDGQRGWKLHAVLCRDTDTGDAIKRLPAACGLEPSHGWGLDLFINTPCKRCQAALRRAGVPEPELFDSPAVGSRRY